MINFSLAKPVSGQGKAFFDQYFQDETMRVDYEHMGDSETEQVVLDRIYRQDLWAGSQKNLIDTLNYGYFRFQLFDEESGICIFSKQFNSNFGEYKVTPFATQGILKSFHESALFPVPVNSFIFKIDKRNKSNEFEGLFVKTIDPEGREVIIDETADPSVLVLNTIYNGDAHTKVDIVFVAEGYAANEINKFEKDLKHFSASLFEKEPMRSNKDKFNIWGTFKASPESGVDQPRNGSFKKTNFGASFNSFDIERYLLIEDNQVLRDVAGHAPYDAIFILVNHDRYGGAGMYNLYCTLTSDNVYSDFLMIHEFGHSFFGLADEYYTSEVGFDDIYGPGYEPIEANITSLQDPAKLKWKHLVKKGTPIPTDWNKDAYDMSDEIWQMERAEWMKKIAELSKSGADSDALQLAKDTYNEKNQAHSKKMYDWLHKGHLADKVGAFEGAGYTSKGMYRPMMDCVMFTKNADDFCKVCSESMQKTIDWYSE